ncbi:MAG: septum formation initiator family protein [Candidatus Omnitrophica bacterium]|nr:septum formation initiator family protein [Candidatus Omnitrophota bacterium]
MIKNALWLFALTLFALFIFLPSYTRLQDLRQKNVDYSKQIEALKQRKIKLLEEKRLLETDPAYLEKVGREKMGLIRKGEVVYKLTPAVHNAEKK